MLTDLATTVTAAASRLPADLAAHGPWDGAGGFSPWFLLFPLFWILVIGLFIFIARRTWRTEPRMGHGPGRGKRPAGALRTR